MNTATVVAGLVMNNNYDLTAVQRCAVMLLSGEPSQVFEAAVACGIVPSDTPATIANVIQVNIEIKDKMRDLGLR